MCPRLPSCQVAILSREYPPDKQWFAAARAVHVPCEIVLLIKNREPPGVSHCFLLVSRSPSHLSSTLNDGACCDLHIGFVHLAPALRRADRTQRKSVPPVHYLRS